MAYYGIVTGVGREDLNLVIEWAFGWDDPNPASGLSWAASQKPIRFELPEGKTRAQILAAIRQRVLAEVKPRVDRAERTKALIDANLDALRTALVGDRYPVA